MIRIFCLTLAVISTASLSVVTAQQTGKVTSSGIGYLEYLPPGYHSSSDKYPVVISLHGIREKGTTSTDPKKVLADLPKVDNVGLPKYVLSGEKYPFILISPQLKSNYGSWPSSYVIQVLNHVKKYLRIDDRRVYLTGLSLGGLGVWRTAGDYPEIFAAIAPICPGGNALSKANELAGRNVAAWGFHGSNDYIVHYSVTTKMIDAMNRAPKKPNPLAKATIFPGMGHIIWDKAYKESNVLSWMLSFRKGSSPPRDQGDEDKPDDESSNKSPIVKAGGDRTLTLPANSVYVQASANDPDGKISSLKWTKVSGGTASLSGTSSSKLHAYNLKEGTYVFMITAKDDDGAVKTDELKVIVKKRDEKPQEEDKPSSKNSLPVVSTGPDRVITLPTNAITIPGRATDKDGRIVSYEWAKTYGNRASLSGANTSTVRISNLQTGIYIFRLRAKDNDGGIKDDYFKITVNEAVKGSDPGKSNSAPVASAGPDRVINWPTNAISIHGVASDKDGRIVSWQWSKTYGNRASLTGTHSQNVRISNLERGIYIFRLTVKDDRGAVKHDYFKITVKDGTALNSERVDHAGRLTLIEPHQWNDRLIKKSVRVKDAFEQMALSNQTKSHNALQTLVVGS